MVLLLLLLLLLLILLRLTWAGHVARMEEEDRSVFKILTGTLTEKRPLGRPRLDGRTKLEWILKK